MNKQDIYNLLEEKGIWHEIVEHEAVWNMEDLAKVKLPYPDADAKNVFVRDDKKQNYYLITVKDDKRVDLKKFNYVFLSFKIGHRKPEDEAYEIVEQTTNIEPENMLFIDDSKENLEVAKQRGWKTCNAFGYELDKIKEAVDKFLK